jgi:hypothetical protein
MPKFINARARLAQEEGKQPSQPPPNDALEEVAAVAKDEAQWTTGKRLVALLALLTAAMFLVMLDNSIIATAVSSAVVGRRTRPHFSST